MSLIKKGAEADLYLGQFYGQKVIKKVRRAKLYRIPQLDFEIRRSRTGHEVQLMHDAKRVGVPTPFIYFVDVDATTIIMQYVEGQRIKEILNALSRDSQFRLCTHIGELIGRLHKNGIIHGDLTTSNMIINKDSKIFLIDFGLAEYSWELEKRGVDMLLARRSFYATHYSCAKECYEALFGGYANELGTKVAQDVTARVEDIGKRGRYSLER